MPPLKKISARPALLISCALTLLVFAAFEPVRHNDFVEFDDNQYLTENVRLRSGSVGETVTWAFTTGEAANWHPLTWLSHALDVRCFGLNPLAAHAHNVLLHALATVLLFLVLNKMTGAVWRSAFVAMVFGIHPLRVESVAWAAERKDVLCAVFWMLTLAAYLGYVGRPGVRRYLLVVFCFALGLMAKPMIVSLPLVLLVLDFWPLNRVSSARYQVSGERRDGSAVFPDTSHLTPDTSRLTRDTSFLIVEKIPLFILALISCVVTWLVQQQGKSMTPDLPFSFRIANALASGIVYPGKMFWPDRLAVLYPYPVEWPLWKPAVALLLLVSWSAFVGARWRRQPYLATGWLWYLIALFPVIGIVQVGAQAMADRYTYLPSIGICIMVAWGIGDVSAGWRHQKTILALGSGAVAAAMLLLTRTQTGCWKDSVALFTHAVAVTRNNYVMHHSLGWVLARQNRLDEAAAQLQRSLQLRPDPETELDMADLLIKRNQLDEAQIRLKHVLNVQPTNSVAHYDVGVILQARGQSDAAMAAYEKAVRFDGNNSRAYNNLGILKTETGSLAAAEECFRQSLRRAPDRADTHRHLAVVLQLQDRVAEAVVHYRAALRLDPNDDKACWSLAYALHGLGQLREAAECDRRTLQLDPHHVRALNDLAWILATSPDPELRQPAEAVRLASHAARLTDFSDPDLLDTLAAAYAGAGQFNSATDTARKAIALARADGQSELAAAIEQRLRLYQSATPYLEAPPENPTSTKRSRND